MVEKVPMLKKELLVSKNKEFVMINHPIKEHLLILSKCSVCLVGIDELVAPSL